MRRKESMPDDGKTLGHKQKKKKISKTVSGETPVMRAS